jgi:hypothetical protein
MSTPRDSKSRDYEEWNPAKFQNETGLDLGEISKSDSPNSNSRPLAHLIAEDHFIIDAALVLTQAEGLKYIPARCLVDTGNRGATAFFVSQKILNRARIDTSELEKGEKHTFRGLGGTAVSTNSCVRFTWHVCRQMTSRMDTFWVVDDDRFDILAPYSLVTGSEQDTDGAGRVMFLLNLWKKPKGMPTRYRSARYRQLTHLHRRGSSRGQRTRRTYPEKPPAPRPTESTKKAIST